MCDCVECVCEGVRVEKKKEKRNCLVPLLQRYMGRFQKADPPFFYRIRVFQLEVTTSRNDTLFKSGSQDQEQKKTLVKVTADTFPSYQAV